MSGDARDLWEKKLAFLQAEEAKAADPALKFELQQGIAEAKAKLEELRPASDAIDQTRPRISTSRLTHGTENLVGREEELERLDEAFADPGTHVVSIVAWAGVGKTALAVEWMTRLAARDWPGVERYFDWSFYSQGTREQGAASADTFIEAALEHFGDPDPKAGSGWDRGERLAGLVAERPTVLVLDGVEPLQHPPGPIGGQLKDPALQALLRGLAQRPFTGLCLVTTRVPVADLAAFHRKTVQEWRLDHLSEDAGAQLLRQAGAEGTDAELSEASEEVGGHALTLQLIGGYVALAHGGDIRKRDLFGFQEADAEIQGGHAFRVIDAYEWWLGGSRSRQTSGSETGPRELAVLRLLGLFDRPADAGCLAALRKEPVIKGLTEPLVGLSDAEWNITLKHLQSLGLITADLRQSAIANRQSAMIDAHPLIREHFAKQLQERQREAWRAAHRRLYEHLTETTPHRPDTLDGLQPLYQAVAHGCQAGLHQEACDEVYRDRILRGTGSGGNYSTFKLGAIGADLGAVACFFEEPWKRLAPALSEAAQAWLLNEAAFRLRALGRLSEAVEPMRAGLQMRIQQKVWRSAAVIAGNLSELKLTLGEVAAAVADAEQSVDLADRSGDAFLRMAFRTTLADALHQSGRRPDARERFREAEAMQAERQAEYPLLYSVQSFQYCDLLLADAERAAWLCGAGFQPAMERKQDACPTERKQDACTTTRSPAPSQRVGEKAKAETANPTQACREVEERAAKTLAWAEQHLGLLDVALDHLTLGRSGLYRAMLEPVAGLARAQARSLATSATEGASEHLAAALAGLRASGSQHHLPRGLLSRSWLRFIEGDPDAARADLDEAWEIAERGSMGLHMADVLLYRGRLFQDPADLAQARGLIEQCGYWRRRQELEDAEEAAKGWTGAEKGKD